MPTVAQKILQAKRKQREKSELTKNMEISSSPKSDEPNTKERKDDEKKDEKKDEDHMTKSIKIANKMWDAIKTHVKEDPKFVEMSDNDKIAVYQKSEFKEFYTEFPIVCRYMICMGQFSNKAFKRYLIKCKNVKHDPVKSREKNYSEDQWVMRQADYIRYLWESYQRQHYKSSEAQNIWKHAYQTLKKEFDDFRNLHEEIENKLKDDEKNNKGTLAKELLKRIANQEQSLDENSTINLLEKLKEQVLEQRKKVLIKSIENDVETIPPTRIAKGCRKELKDASV